MKVSVIHFTWYSVDLYHLSINLAITVNAVPLPLGKKKENQEASMMMKHCILMDSLPMLMTDLLMKWYCTYYISQLTKIRKKLLYPCLYTVILKSLE